MSAAHHRAARPRGLGGAGAPRRRRRADPARADAGRSTALWTDRSILAPDLATTTWEVLLGLAARDRRRRARSASPCTSRRRARRALRPLVIGSQAVPVPVIAPLVILVLGFGLAPKVLLVALVCFFPVAINLYDGLRDTDADARKLLRSLDATRWQTLRMLEAAERAARDLHRRQDRRRGRGDRRRVRRVGGLGRRPRPRAADRQRPARDRARVRRHRCCCSCSPSRSTARSRCSSGASSTGPRASIPEDHDPPRARCSRSLIAPSSPAAARSPSPGRRLGQDRDAHGHARLLPQRRPRRALRGAGERASTSAPGLDVKFVTPPRCRRRRSSCCRRAGSTSRCPTSRTCCWRAIRERTSSRSARSSRSR